MSENILIFNHERQPNGSWSLTGTVHNPETLEDVRLKAAEVQQIVGRVHAAREPKDARQFGTDRTRRDILRVIDQPAPDAQILGGETSFSRLPVETAAAIVSLLGDMALGKPHQGV